MTTILLVEDEQTLRTTIAYNLERAGFTVRAAEDGDEALRLANAEPPDVVVLDVMLPTIDGFDVCRQIRRTSAVPIIILTARDEEIDRVVGLEIGADDYLTKPFSMRELIARIKELLRRRELLRQELSQSSEAGSILRVGDLTIDFAAYRVLVGDQVGVGGVVEHDELRPPQQRDGEPGVENHVEGPGQRAAPSSRRAQRGGRPVDGVVRRPQAAGARERVGGRHAPS